MSAVELILAAVVAGSGAPVPAAQAEGCVRAVAALAGDATPVEADFAPAPCPAAAKRAFRYDRVAREVRAARPIAVGDVVPAPPAALLAKVRPGDRLHMTVRVGPVTVDREVVALQVGHEGGAVFVRSAEGAVFAAPMQALSP